MDSRRVRKPVLHLRVIAPEELAESISDRLADFIEQEYELIEVTGSRPIFGDEQNVKIYITAR